jgi:phospholipase C
VANSSAIIAEVSKRPKPAPPSTPEQLFQEPGVRRSRALPYELHVQATFNTKNQLLALKFRNTGKAGAVLHVYDKLRLEQIPRRYTVESGKDIADEWHLGGDDAHYDLWVYGPNGFIREFRGSLTQDSKPNLPEFRLEYEPLNGAIHLVAKNPHHLEATLHLRSNAYSAAAPQFIRLSPGITQRISRSVVASHNWYDFTVFGEGFEQRFAGRMESGQPSYTDPAI